MYTDVLTSPVGKCKIATLVLGSLILAVGLFSHFQSAWVKSDKFFVAFGHMIPYKYCEIDNVQDCPKISMERFFVAMIIISFLVSLLGFITSLFEDMTRGILKHVDKWYHVVTAILLVVSAIVYIVSAEQIHERAKDIDGNGVNFRRIEKLTAASLAILQSVLYGATALVIHRTNFVFTAIHQPK